MNILKYAMCFVIAMALTACGGGGGNPGSTGADAGRIGVGGYQSTTLSLELKNLNDGATTQSVGAQSPVGAVLVATLLGSNKRPVPGKPININTGNSSLIILSNPDIAKKGYVTDDQGQVTLNVKRVNDTEYGDGTISASFVGTGLWYGTTTTTNGTTTTTCGDGFSECFGSSYVNIPFRVEPPYFEFPEDKRLVNDSGLTTLKVKLKFADGTPMAQKRVDVTSDPDGKVVFPEGSSQVTDGQGDASIKIARGTNANGAGSLRFSSTIGGSYANGQTYTTTVKGNWDYQVGVIPSFSQVSSVDVTASTNALQSAGQQALITALVKDGNNVGMPNQAVVFSASSGTLQKPDALTDASGVATVQLAAGNNKSNRDITVSAAVSSVTGKVVVPVTGSKLTITGATSLQSTAGPQDYSVRASDSSGNPVAGASITVSSSKNGVNQSELTTNLTGLAKFTYTPTNAGTDKLSVVGLGTSAESSVTVSSVDFKVVPEPKPGEVIQIEIGKTEQIIVRYQVSGAGVPGSLVTFNTTRGTIVDSSQTTTDSEGKASVKVSSSTAGSAVVTAQITQGSSVIGSVSLPVQFVSSTPAVVLLQANPGAILPNTTGSTNQSTIQALVRDASGNPVASRQVNFTIRQDLSNGSLSSGSAKTDSNGLAQVQFIAGASSTPSEGVIIDASVAIDPTGAGAVVSANPAAKLTVNGNALFISIGFGVTIEDLGVTDYSKPFSVYVTDANGVAVGNQLISLSVIPEEYYKGSLTQNAAKTWVSGVKAATCPNEDKNLNGILDTGEDSNANGRLTPGNVAVSAPGSVVTDTTGRATFAVRYGKQYAPWVKTNIGARAIVAGTESVQSISYTLAMSIEDAKLESGPAGVNSPFGQSGNCADAK